MIPFALSRFLSRGSHAARLTAACAAALAFSSTAFAHALPTTREPAPNTTVSAPAQVTIHFSEPLEPAFSKITLTDAQGHEAVSGAAAVDPQDKATLRLALQPLAPGRYTVHWTAVASDGHRTHGDYAFTVK